MLENLHHRIVTYREMSFRTTPALRIQTQQQGIDFINQRGFILFHPAKDLEFPSLWAAKAGNRPVPNEHDDPGHVTWTWKDELLGRRKCYYNRLLGQKMSFVSNDLLPSFYRFSQNFEYENDYLLQYQKGEMSYEAKRLYECLLEKGPLDTLALRKMAGLSGKENQYRYSKTLYWLQTKMMVMPIGIAEVGRWKYGFILDIVPRYLVDLPDLSLSIKERFAREQILEALFLSLGACSESKINKILGWSLQEIAVTISDLREKGVVTPGVEVAGNLRPQVVLNELLI